MVEIPSHHNFTNFWLGELVEEKTANTHCSGEDPMDPIWSKSWWVLCTIEVSTSRNRWKIVLNARNVAGNSLLNFISLGVQFHCDMMIRGSNHTLIMVVTILRRWLDPYRVCNNCKQAVICVGKYGFVCQDRIPSIGPLAHHYFPCKFPCLPWGHIRLACKSPIPIMNILLNHHFPGEFGVYKHHNVIT